VICPVCGSQNLQGEDECANCGADLRTVDIPGPSTALEDRLVRDHLDRVHGRDPILVKPDAPVRAALRQMQDERANAVLIGDGTHLAGIFTERDALMQLAGRSLDGLTMAEVMTPDPVVLRPDDTIAVAIHKMAVGGFRHIPLVAEDGHISGIVTAQDVMRHILALLG
jgi:CBS domain-containing protein